MGMTKIFTDWSDELKASYGKKPIIARHNLHESEMFSDDGLADLLDRYPRERLGVYTMGDNPEEWRTFVKGDAGGLSGAELVKAVKTGRFWMNLRAVNHELDDYRDLCGRMFSEFDANTGQRTMKQDLGVLISSPNAQVFYHLDIPLVLLWQVRGIKRVWIYPPTADFAPDADIESVVLRETEEEFDYSPDFDEQAFLIDLEPGMVANWPQTAPHRIANHDMLNVSLSVEYMSIPALAHANMLYTNGVLRRKFGATPNRSRDVGARMWAKALAARAFKLTGARKTFQKNSPVRFRVDPQVEGGVVFLENESALA